MPNRILPLALTTLLGIAATTHATTYVWWEAEDATSTDLSTQGGYHHLSGNARTLLSGGEWLNGKKTRSGMHADYEVAVPAASSYVLYVRKFWKHGMFKWRFGQQDWTLLGHDQKTLDSVGIAPYVPACWVRLGKVNLKAGKQPFRIELVRDSGYQFADNYGYDCFMLVDHEIKPAGLTKPDACAAAAPVVESGPARKLPSPDTNVPPEEESLFGRHIARTVSLLESATAEYRTPVNILFYGQSIVGTGYPTSVVKKHLAETYPHAKIRINNRAIGGCQAPKLQHTAFYDLYPEDPDLVIFHVYGGESRGELEGIHANIRKYTTAEVLTWTHHVDCNSSAKSLDSRSAVRRELAGKYGFELADVRERWKRYLVRTGASARSLLRDNIHPNGQGGTLLGEMLLPHFKVQPVPASRGKWVRTYALNTRHPVVSFSTATWKRSGDGLVCESGTSPLKLTFTGNRVELEALPLSGETGSARILLDGKPASQCPDTYAVSRPSIAPKGWWPVVDRIYGSDLVSETWTLSYRDITPDGKSFVFDLKGSKTAADGSGEVDTAFTSNSGRIRFDAHNPFRGVKKYLGKNLDPSFTATFKTYCMSKDTWKMPGRAKPGEVSRSTLLHFWTSGKHTLEIVPDGNGPIGIRSLIVHQPPLAP